VGRRRPIHRGHLRTGRHFHHLKENDMLTITFNERIRINDAVALGVHGFSNSDISMSIYSAGFSSQISITADAAEKLAEQLVKCVEALRQPVAA
jgi:hypothetical protein